MKRIQIASILPDTEELSARSGERSPRKAPAPGSPAELRCLVKDIVGHLARTHKTKAIQTAVARSVSSVNSYRNADHRLQRPSRGMVKHLLLQHRRRLAMHATSQEPEHDDRLPDEHYLGWPS